MDGILITCASHLSCPCTRRSSTGIILQLWHIWTWVTLFCQWRLQMAWRQQKS